MSCSISGNLLPETLTDKFPDDLIVKGKETQYGIGASIELLQTTINKNNDIIANFPFAYYYHHIAKYAKCNYPNESINFTKRNHLKFVGTLNDIQNEIKQETFDILNETRSIIISLGTGFGKTIFAIYLATKLKLKICVVCHRLIIIDQWKDSIQKVCPNAKLQIVDTKCVIDDDTDFIIINVNTIRKRDRIEFADFGFVIVDEAHTMCTSKSVESLFLFSPKYFIGLTATPERSDGMHVILERFFGPNIIERKLKKLFNCYTYNTTFKPKKEYTMTGSLDWNSLLESMCNDVYRNELIVDMARFFKHRNILILCKRLDQTQWLYEKLKEYSENVDIFTGKQKNFSYDCRILVATYSVSGVGFNYPKLNMLIVGSDVVESHQQYIGRVIRCQTVIPVIIELIDNDFTLKKHLKSRIEIYNEIGGVVKKLENSFLEFDKWKNSC